MLSQAECVHLERGAPSAPRDRVHRFAFLAGLSGLVLLAVPSRASELSSSRSSAPSGGTGFEFGVLVGPTRPGPAGSRTGVVPLLGLTALWQRRLTSSLSWSAGISILPLPKGALGFAVPARFEWLPVRNWQPGTPGSLTFGFRAGGRLMFIEPFGVATGPNDQSGGGLSSAGGILGEAGVVFRSGTIPKQAFPFEVAFSGMAGPVVPYGSGLQTLGGVYRGGAMSLATFF
jgi:hypothetical protein